MPTPQFIKDLRSHVGHDLLLLTAVEAVVLRNDTVLLVRRADTSRWVLPGGIVEPGEFVADVVERELFEESGVRGIVERLLLLTTDPPMTYPNGDRCQFLMSIFQCRRAGFEPNTDDDEVSGVAWYPVYDLPSTLHDRGRRCINLALNCEGPVFDSQNQR